MNVFGLDAAEVRRLVEAVSTSCERDSTAVADRFATAAWSNIAEPGDGVAGAVIATLGAGVALRALVDRWSADEIVRASSAGLTEVELLPESVASALERWRPRVQSAAVVRSLQRAAAVRAILMTPSDSAWPVGLAALGVHAPNALWRRGRRESLGTLENSVSLVGARASTGYGEHVAMESSAGLVSRGFSIVSGAAYGIDGMAHRAALASGGETVAFLAGGVDRFYPTGHDALLSRIVDQGAVFSELPCGSAPTKWRFLQRNRLIAAVSAATIVLEAGSRSGSLNTAGHAASLGRPLGAVPGPVTSPASAGCHRLLRDYGATCVTDAEQMAELAGSGGGAGSGAHGRPALPSGAAHQSARMSAEEVRVLDALSRRSARTLLDISARAGMSTTEVGAVLGMLSLDRAVIERPTGWMRTGGGAAPTL